MAEEMLSYSTRNVQDWSMFRRFEVHTSRVWLHSVEAAQLSLSDMNVVTFAGGVR
jgi:phosphoribosylformylglycinamidine (FGAM) synthase-like amidotransferase family enzyme